MSKCSRHVAAPDGTMTHIHQPQRRVRSPRKKICGVYAVS
jgi:hypothetical protein